MFLLKNCWIYLSHRVLMNVLFLVSSLLITGINQNWTRHLETSGPFQSNNTVMYFPTYYIDSSNHFGSYTLKVLKRGFWFDFLIFYFSLEEQSTRYAHFHFIIPYHVLFFFFLNICLLTRLALQGKKGVFISGTPM